jgi:putative peptidoglycan lipid II flippase
VSKLRISGIAAGAGATILLSFLSQWFILTRLGAGRVTDAYFAALAVPIVMLYVLGDPLNRVALPILSVKKGAEYWTYAWTTMQVSTLMFLGIAAAIFLSAPSWIPYLVPGFSSEATRKTIDLTRILVLGMVFQGASITARAAWNGRTYFIWPSMAGVIGVSCSLLFLVMTLRRFGVSAAAWAFNIRFGVECLLLVGPLGSYARPRWQDVPSFMRRARPLILGAAYFRTDVLVDRVLTSLAPPGSLSLLYLAQQLLSAIGQVINQSVVTPSIPSLANTAHVGDWNGFARRVRSAIRNLLALGTLIILALLVFGGPALSLLFAHQAMGAQDIHRLLILILSLGGMLLADGVVYFAYSSFYSAGDTATPTIATAVVYSLSVIAKIAAFLLAGIVGLALAISAYYVLNAIVLLFLLHRKLGRLNATGEVQPSPDPIAPTPIPPSTAESY